MKYENMQFSADNVWVNQNARDSRQYEDIIHLPHPVSPSHPPMPVQDRAAQFAPFSALKGYEEAIEETTRVNDGDMFEETTRMNDGDMFEEAIRMNDGTMEE